MLRYTAIFLVILLSACSGADIFGKRDQEIIITSTVNAVSVNSNITITAASTGTLNDQGTGNITYRSNNPTIASVNSTTGVVSGISIGVVSIIATKAEDGIFDSANASVQVTVNGLANPIAFEQITLSVLTTQENITYAQANLSISSGSITLSSNNPSVVQIIGTNTLDIVGAGVTIITANQLTDNIYDPASASQTITVSLATQVISFATNTVGGVVGVTFSNALTDGIGSGTISYISSSNTIATVDNTGDVSPMILGVITITATKAEDAVYASTNASYQAIIRDFQSISFATPSINILTTNITFSATVTDNAPGSGSITYNSSNTNIATVASNTGLITPITSGTITIIATKAADISYGAAMATYSLIISPTTQTISFTSNTINVITTDASFTNPLIDIIGSGSLTYNSSSDTIATINSSGTVDPLTTGTITITVNRAADALYSATSNTYTVIITLATPSISFTDSATSILATNQNFVNPVLSNQNLGNITYSSSNENIATISSTGLITPVAAGVVTISATTTANNVFRGANISYELTITLAPQNISFASSTINILRGNTTTHQLSNFGFGLGAVTYASSNPNVASVDENTGQINAFNPGDIIITATKAQTNIYQSSTTTYDLIVRITQSINFASNPVTVFEDSPDFTNALTDFNTSIGNSTGVVTYASSLPAVASVNNTGLVDPLATGTVTITATKAQDNTYAPTSASYILVIQSAASVTQSTSFAANSVNVLATDANFTNALLLSNITTANSTTTYGSSNSTIASVNADGLVDPLIAGTITITATTTVSNATFTASYQLIVSRSPQSIDFASATVNAVIGTPFTNITTEVGTGSTTYSSSNETVATVGATTGIVTPLTSGNITITATKASNTIYNTTTSSYALVSRATQSISFASNTVTVFINSLNFINILTDINTQNNNSTGVVTYSSSNDTIATVDVNTGSVNPLVIGNVVITANKTQGDTYAPTSASYTLFIINLPASPSITRVVTRDTRVSLFWQAVTSAERYNVYFATQTISSTALLNIPSLPGGGSQTVTNTNITISSLVNDVAYFFIVTSMISDQESGISNEVSSTPTQSAARLGALNDTGVTFGGNVPTGNQTNTCNSDSADITNNNITQQDCAYGRDILSSEGLLDKVSAGQVGFDFTKLGANGLALTTQNVLYDDTLSGVESSGSRWSCVRDNRTGLTWEVKINRGTAPATITAPATNNIHHRDNGYLWGGVSAIGIANTLGFAREGFYSTVGATNTWDILVDGSNADSLCSLNNWRVPTLEELASISHKGVPNNTAGNTIITDSAIDSNYFPNTPNDFFWWSASPRASTNTGNVNGQAWAISFSSGFDALLGRNGFAYARLVSSSVTLATQTIAITPVAGQTCPSYIPNHWQDSRYASNTNGTVIDTVSTLMWKQCSENQTINDLSCNGTLENLTWQETLNQPDSVNTTGFAGFNDWRLPNVEELRSLVARNCHTPSINATIFPNTDASADGYWSSTPSAIDNTSANTVSFRDGDDAVSLKDSNTRRSVRLVRDTDNIDQRLFTP